MNKTATLIDPVSYKSFLQFSERLCSVAGAEEACVSLQRKYALNSNILLLCCWAPFQNYRNLEIEDIHRIEKCVLPWHEKVVLHLLELCNVFPKLKISKKAEDLYFLAQENRRYAEKIERLILLEGVENFQKVNNIKKEVLSLVLSNIFSYLKAREVNFHKNDLEKVYRIVKACA
ncbi:MAG: DUF2390 domain-containing protein [Gammaproteobacteria bacterium]|nr:DUF2390 domain-containing protein [Gammaproteobacteria bacterium]